MKGSCERCGKRRQLFVARYVFREPMASLCASCIRPYREKALGAIHGDGLGGYEIASKPVPWMDDPEALRWAKVP
jgi:hypothetical protein